MKKTAELLGIDPEAMSEKATNYTQLFVTKTMMEGDPDRQILVDHVRDNFSYDELVYMSMFWLQDKSEQILKEYLNDKLKALTNDPRV